MEISCPGLQPFMLLISPSWTLNPKVWFYLKNWLVVGERL